MHGKPIVYEPYATPVQAGFRPCFPSAFCYYPSNILDVYRRRRDGRRCHSRGGGPITVVAVHGIQGTRGAWLPLARQLADRCTFILPNLPGRGLAKAPASEDDCTLDAYARALGRTITRHVDGPFVLAGWSMGVSVALAYLSQARTTAAWPSPAELLLVSGTPYLDAVAWFPPSSPDALLEAIATREQRLGLREAADHRTVAWTWNAIRRTDQRGELAHITTPALVIHG